MKEGMEKQEEAIGSGLTKMSRRPGANCWRRSAKHREEAAGRGRREPAHPCAHCRGAEGRPARGRPYLEQQLEPRDALEGQNEEGLEGQALAHGVTLQLLQHVAEAAVRAPVWAVSRGQRAREAGAHGEGLGGGRSGQSLRHPVDGVGRGHGGRKKGSYGNGRQGRGTWPWQGLQGG